MDFEAVGPLEAMDRSMAATLARPLQAWPNGLRAGSLAALLTALLIASALVLLPSHGSPATGGSRLSGRATVFAPGAAAGLSLAAQAQVTGQLAAERPAFAVSRAGAGFRATTPGQGLLTRFDRSGVSVVNDGLSLKLSLSSLTLGGVWQTLAARGPTAKANGVSYSRGRLREWYRNGPLGIEQGFTVARARQGAQGGTLTLTMALTGNGAATLSRDARTLTLRRGQATLTYGGLAASDATGRALHSWLGLHAGRLALHVDAAGARYPLTIDPLIQNAKLTSGELEDEARFGSSLALSADGRTLVVGGPNDAGSQGAVWFFVKQEGAWKQQGPKQTTGAAAASSVPSECAEESAEEAEECAFGSSVALSADGNTALVGDPSPTSMPGAAWVLTRSGSTWTAAAVLKGTNETGEGRFGRSVALSADGATALVGDPSAFSQRGAAWAFTRSGESWSSQATLTDAEQSPLAHLGRSVALSGDGNTALVGGPGDSGFAGAAWTFSRTGSAWTGQVAKLTGTGESGAGHFGKAVALSADGATALVGGQDDAEERGAVWAFARTSPPLFTAQGGKIEPAPALGAGHFGSSLALSGDGTSALVGAPHAEAGFGAAVQLLRSGSSWTQESERVAGAEAVGKGLSGTSVSLSGDGSTASIGAPRDQKRAGAAWVFTEQTSVARPTVINVLPARGPSAGGTEVEIRGTNFNAAKKVRFGEREAQFVVLDATRIKALTPSAPAGRVEVTVTTPAGTSALSPPSDYFTFERTGGESSGSSAWTGTATNGTGD